MSSPVPSGDTLLGDRSSTARQEPVAPADDIAAAQAAREEAIRALLALPDEPRPTLIPPAQVPVADRLVSASPGTRAPETQPANLPVFRTSNRGPGTSVTLAEASFGLVALVLAGVLVFLAGREWNSRARAARCAEELRGLAAAFEQFRQEEGKWPAAATARGAIPAGMERLLSADMWARPTPLGGHYAWVKAARQNPPALAITAFVPDAPLALSADQLRRIDALLDDGDLATGRFRTGFNGWPVFFLKGD